METARHIIRIGIAGWAIRREHDSHYDPAPISIQKGGHLSRYATRFNAVEINSSFYRSHRRSTYERWAASVPAHFRFAVKMPRTITHEVGLKDCGALLDAFLEETSGLGRKQGPLLIQLPAKFSFDAAITGAFFAGLRERFTGDAVCEPRHANWFTQEADRILRDFQIARVAADPAPADGAGRPGGWDGLVYYRLHGSPRMYYSAYENAALVPIAKTLARFGKGWCIFDNTARGAAVENGLEMMALTKREGRDG